MELGAAVKGWGELESRGLVGSIGPFPERKASARRHVWLRWEGGHVARFDASIKLPPWQL